MSVSSCPTLLVHIQNSPIELKALLDLAEKQEEEIKGESGALLLFCGQVRSSSIDLKTGKKKQVRHLEYEAHISLAQKIMQQIAEECSRERQVHFCACIHRIGLALPQETTVAIVTAGRHRAEVYAANRQLIDRIKSEVPLWKKEVYMDDSYQWGSGSCNTETSE